jgi:hypothetical protein
MPHQSINQWWFGNSAINGSGSVNAVLQERISPSHEADLWKSHFIVLKSDHRLPDYFVVELS